MNKRRIAVSLAVLGSMVAIAALVQPLIAQVLTPPRPAPYIGAQRVIFSYAQVEESGWAIRAFVRTGSLSANCLATMAESSFAVPGTVVFCGPRAPQGLGKGIIVSVFFPQPPPADLVHAVTLYQEDAIGYAEPVLCNVEGC